MNGSWHDDRSLEQATESVNCEHRCGQEGFSTQSSLRYGPCLVDMKILDLTKRDLELVSKAKELIQKRKSKRSSVASVLRTRKDKVFQGVNIEIECSAPCSICAEYAAIGTMVSEGEEEIETIVAVSNKEGGYVLPPCGKCRQFISEFGNPYVIIQVEGALKKVQLSELYPLPCVSE
jgi:cytidine deaminase